MQVITRPWPAPRTSVHSRTGAAEALQRGRSATSGSMVRRLSSLSDVVPQAARAFATANSRTPPHPADRRSPGPSREHRNALYATSFARHFLFVKLKGPIRGRGEQPPLRFDRDRNTGIEVQHRTALQANAAIGAIVYGEQRNPVIRHGGSELIA